MTASRPGKAPVTAAKSGWLDRLRRFDVAFPALLWLAVVLWARLVFGFHFVISWGIYQILDRRDLVEHPILSLLMLHAQPPALNAILAFDLQLERWLGIPVEVSLNLLFTLAGTLAAIAVYQVLLWTTRHRAASIAGLILLLVDPAQDYYSSIGAYPFLLYLLCAAYIWFAAAYARDGRTRSFAGLAASTAALALTQTLFHPVWVMATLLLAVGLRIGFRAPRLPVRAGEIRVLLMTAVVLVLWPAKNWLVFRQFTYSSWTGYNLAHTTPMYSRLIDAFNEYGIVDQSRVESYPLPGWIPPAGREMLLRPRKGPEAENTANWNHLIFLVENRELAAVALRWRRQHPGLWIASHVPFHYSCYTHAPIVHPYTRRLLGPKKVLWRLYAYLHTQLVYPDTYPYLWRLLHWPPPEARRAPDSLYPQWCSLTLFGLVTFPVVLGWGIVRSRRARPADPRRMVIVLATGIILWQFAVSLSTDGAEGMRFRFSTLPAFALLGSCVLAALAAKRRRSWPRGG